SRQRRESNKSRCWRRCRTECRRRGNSPESSRPFLVPWWPLFRREIAPNRSTRACETSLRRRCSSSSACAPIIAPPCFSSSSTDFMTVTFLDTQLVTSLQNNRCAESRLDRLEPLRLSPSLRLNVTHEILLDGSQPY